MATRGPVLPPRRQDTLDDTAGVDDAPPAYEAHPATQGEATLEFGPSRPFQPAPAPPPPQQAHYTGQHPAPPQHPSLTGNSYQSNYNQPQHTGQSSPLLLGYNLDPPQFPFWNGASLTPAQTGFSEGAVSSSSQSSQGAYQPPYQVYTPPTGPPPGQQHIQPQPTGASYAPPPGPPPQLPPRQAPGSGYNPTTTPTAGQPYLNNGRLLVYPIGREVCWKCQNTGYKENDPTHPCRKCWEKFGKQYHGALKLAATSSSQAPPNYQRPLKTFAPRISHPPPPQHGAYPGHHGPAWQGGMQQGPRPQVFLGYGAPPMGSNTLVLRPGDPRMGGVLCQKCGGSGLTMGFLFDEDQCSRCHGVGRLFWANLQPISTHHCARDFSSTFRTPHSFAVVAG